MYISLFFTMKWLVAFVCVVAVASADPWCGCGPPPPPPLICPPEVIVEPVLPPVVGLLSQVINTLIADAAESVSEINALVEANNKNLEEFTRASGGPGFNNCAKINQFIRASNVFWQSVADITADLSWNVAQVFEEALGEIEKQFRLVINQPLVQSLLRELRDIPRIVRNLGLAALQARRAEWLNISAFYSAELTVLVQNGLCSSPQNMQERFYRVLEIGAAEASAVLGNLKTDLDAIVRAQAIRALQLANQIYEIEIVALSYFVT